VVAVGDIQARAVPDNAVGDIQARAVPDNAVGLDHNKIVSYFLSFSVTKHY